MKARLFLILSFCFATQAVLAQKGKNGVVTLSSANTQVNAYTSLTADASSGDTRIKVANSSLSDNFSDPLQTGDLILIYQVQGASILGTLNGNEGNPNDATWGQVTDYGSCGNYELVEVIKSNHPDSIGLACPLQHDYSVAGHTQIIRVPRYSSLTIGSGASITCPAWDGSTGGVVVIEADAEISLDGSIDVSEKGFRGGSLIGDNATLYWPGYASTNNQYGAEKGEGIAGYQDDYGPLGGKYSRGAAANAGGGGNAHNAGGGGGGNAGADIQSYGGFGIPDHAYDQAWALESSSLIGASSPGGGKGGYTFSSSNCDALTQGPHHSCWNGDGRRPYGGEGGRPLDYSNGKIFLGGGGGAGDQNDNDGGVGGRGGGLVFIECYGNIIGAGTILANGQAGEDTDPSNPPFNNYSGKDGAGGAGAGGTVLVNVKGTISTSMSIQANGGDGGDQVFGIWPFVNVSEAQGPGGGGGGGYIALSSAGPITLANGGASGVTESPHLSEFPPNGATGGSAGLPDETLDNWYLQVTNQSVCPGNTVTFDASVVGSLPQNTEIVWYDSEIGGNVLGTGTPFTTDIITESTIYYLGTCPGHYRIPAIVFLSIDYTILGNVEICQGESAEVLGEIRTEPGVYTDTVQSSMGCDSILQQELVVSYVDTSVIENVNILTANTSGAQYQWLDCDNWQFIQGEDGQSYAVINSGSYAVMIAENGCIDTSACHYILVTDIDEVDKDEILVYPNPVNDFLAIEIPGDNEGFEVQVFNMAGQVVVSPLKISKTNRFNLSVENLGSGIYFLRIRFADNQKILKFQKL